MIAERPRTAAIVAPSPVPLRLGGAERHWEGLRRALEDRGVATDVVKLPVRELALTDLVDGYEDFRLLDLSHVDLVITGKYPAWMVQHPRHVVWMLHPLRGLYDTYNPAAHEHERLPDDPVVDALLGALDAGPESCDPLEVIDLVRSLAERLGPEASDPGGALAVPGPLARRVVRHLDRWALAPSRTERLLAISREVAGREGYFSEADDVGVIHPPSCLPDPTGAPAPGRGFLAVGRLDRPKRIDLAITAVRRLDDPDARLTVVGDGPDRPRLEALAGDDGRIRFAGRVDDATLRAEYLAARAVLVTPEHEDFGYVTIEAMQHGRAVLTTTDSGGPAELVTDSVDGLVVAPTAEAVAEALDRLGDEGLARRLGDAGRATAAHHSWDDAVRRLTEPPPGSSRDRRSRRAVAVSTYPLTDWPGGGPQRAVHLLSGLATEGWEVAVVALAEAPRPRTVLDNGLTEVVVAPSERHHSAETRLRRITGNVAVTDIAASVLWPSTPELVRELRHALREADVAIAVQPYLAPAIAALAPDVPLVLDAHNHERSLKGQMLPGDSAGRWMLDRVAAAEHLAAARAALVVAATQEDGEALAADHGLSAADVVVVPNGVDIDAAGFTPPEERAANSARLRSELDPGGSCTATALFVGSAHSPNVEAAREVLRLAAGQPEVLFVLAGEHGEHLGPTHGANVRVLGPVPPDRLDELLAAADVAVNPMVSGGGSNLKMLGYLAAGVPVVSTPLGARGLPDTPEVVVTAELGDFGDALTESLRSPDADRVSAARELVVADYDWRRLAGRFAAAVTALLPSDAPVGPRPDTTQDQPVTQDSPVGQETPVGQDTP